VPHHKKIHKAWKSLILREEHGLRLFKNRVLRREFGPKRENEAEDWRKLHNEERHIFLLFTTYYCADKIN
jgi:hypothetical protein